MKTSFSVLIPSATCSPDLRVAVQTSLRAAARARVDAEVVVVGDGWDPSEALKGLRAIALAGPKVGISEALNAGLLACRGEYIVRMDADDICHPKRFEFLSAALDEQRPDLLVGQIVTFGEFSARRLAGPKSADAVREGLLHEGYAIPHPGVSVRRESLLGVGGYRSEWDGVEDLDLWLRLMSADLKLRLLGTPATFYRLHQGQATRSVETKRFARNRIALEADSRQPCSDGCPGRLSHFEAFVDEKPDKACPRFQSSFPLRLIVASSANPTRKIDLMTHKVASGVKARMLGRVEFMRVRRWLG